ncbi:MAG: phosphotransferase enzyme family protein [Calditrichaeota bacterium]|nr:MAG: phosphotransferase enzyme family protein [Calditrichota bacterium]MBL1205807.1 phosphotransferase enzyme family protein [Calditrichota bacterium]NOG45635.1 phosphotransferase [Calditrichota bacterium]
MDSIVKNSLSEMFERWAKEKVKSFTALPAHGSYRRYFRITGETKQAIGVFNEDIKENIAFLNFSKHFLKHNLKVPEIYEQELDKNIYLEEDLGDETLFSFLTKKRDKDSFSEELKNQYKKVIAALPRFQVTAGKDLDYSVCYPRSSFDRQSMMWDLNYFKYYFLKLAKIPFDEQQLEDDYQTFVDFLLGSQRDYFLYRDFQSRNVMIHNNDVYFIDYQGGRKGALQYDLASLLYDAKADIPPHIRKELLEIYLDELEKLIPVDREKFLQYYHGYVFIRIMQALGAYGFRGFYERKEHFLKSVPFAIQNLERLLHSAKLPIEIPALTDAWSRLVRSSYLRTLSTDKLRLTIRIDSFSYKRGIPWDEKGHGGGFVFDCRSLHNPGRYNDYKFLTGNDQPVIDFLEKEGEVNEFLAHIYAIVDSAVNKYQSRNFTDLMIAFGCTGGQHRSVYCANQLAAHLGEKFDTDIKLRHREQEMKNN